MAGGGKGGQTSQSVTPDATLTAYRNQVMQQAGNLAGRGGLTQGAENNPLIAGGYASAVPNLAFGQNFLQNYTSQGFDPASAQRFMNPYQNQVIGAANQQFNRQNQIGLNQLAGNATTQGAFGGTRAAVSAGNFLSGQQLGQNAQIAQLLQSGYGQALQNAMADQSQRLGTAGSLANLGMGALGGYGAYQQGLGQSARQLAALPFGAPYGTTQTATAARNPFTGALGGAATGAEIGSVIPGLGTAVGAGIGGILGLL